MVKDRLLSEKDGCRAIPRWGVGGNASPLQTVFSQSFFYHFLWRKIDFFGQNSKFSRLRLTDAVDIVSGHSSVDISSVVISSVSGLFVSKLSTKII